MPITEEEQIQANSELRQKVTLENIFKPDIKKLFARMVRDFTASVFNIGNFQPAQNYMSDWETILKIHYDRVQKSFTGIVPDQQKAFLCDWYLKGVFEKQATEEEQRLRAEFGAALIRWRNVQSKEQARFITDTNTSNMNDALRESRERLIADGEDIDNRNVATTATPILKRKFVGRVDAVTMTETQSASESTKLMEAEIMSGESPQISGPVLFVSASKKVWVTVGDKKVRQIHINANGQTRNINEPFFVGGEQLMHPGDSSLGASIGNFGNCRCSSQFRIV